VRWLLVLALVGACDDEDPVLIGDVPRELSLDVRITPGFVSVFTNGTDQTCACSDTNWAFAPVGGCLDIDDVLLCECSPLKSCLDARLVGTNVSIEASTALPFGFQLPSSPPTDLQLELSGCGHGTTAIPIDSFTPPTPAVVAERSDRTITARWQTDAPAASAYVSFGFTYVAHECHTAAAERAYVLPSNVEPAFANISVTAFLAPLTIASDLGDVRVWRGNAAGTTLYFE
jgi:hypothetical protein